MKKNTREILVCLEVFQLVYEIYKSCQHCLMLSCIFYDTDFGETGRNRNKIGLNWNLQNGLISLQQYLRQAPASNNYENNFWPPRLHWAVQAVMKQFYFE